jgi:hypothetical protein
MSAGALHQAALVAANSLDWYSYSNLAALLTVAGVTCDENVVKFMIARSPALRGTLDLSLNATGVYQQKSGQERYLQLRRPNEKHNWENPPPEPSPTPARALSPSLKQSALAAAASAARRSV